MKKTLIALAAVAAVGAASAQVTVYGKADVGIANSSSGVQVVSGGYEGSRVGVKGSTDLGSGLTGSFQLEGGVSTVDGAFGGFTRVASASVSGGFGTVAAGRMWTLYDVAIYSMDALEYSSYTPQNALWAYDLGLGNVKGAIQYSTPVMAGLQAQVLVAPNAVDATDVGVKNYSGYGLTYNQGPISLTLATQSYNKSGDVQSLALAGSYNLGPATIYLGNTTTDDKATSTKAVGNTFGLKVPMGVGYATVGYATNTGTKALVDTNSSSIAAQYIYKWNKSAVIYAAYRSTTTTVIVNTTAAGVRYNF